MVFSSLKVEEAPPSLEEAGRGYFRRRRGGFSLEVEEGVPSLEAGELVSFSLLQKVDLERLLSAF